ncbi:MAG: AI-2E family transporter [Opitutae bacterium]
MSEEKKSTKVLTPGLSKLLGITLSVGCIFIISALAVRTVQLLGNFLGYFSSVLWPLAISSVLAILLFPLVRAIEQKAGLSRAPSILLLYFLTIGICSLVTWSLGGELIKQSRELASASIDWPERIEEKIRTSVSPETWNAVSQKFLQFKGEWKQVLGNLAHGMPEISKGSAQALQDAWAGIGSFFSWFACLAIVPVYLFYFLGSKEDYLGNLAGQFNFLNQNIRQDLVYLIRQFKEILEGFFRGQLIIGAMMGFGYAVGFSLSGLKFGITLGLFFGILNIVPFLGTILGIFSVFAVSYLQTGGILDSGQWHVLWGCGITFAVVQLLESYWLSPKVMGDRTGLHPVVIIASVFFWGVALDGILGMILGIPLTAFLIVFWRLLRRKYLVA